MDAFEYRFTSKTGDVYIVRILNDGARFLSSEMISALEKSDVEVWGIYLNRVGSYKHVTGIRDLSLISNQIYSFFRSHDNVREEQLDVAKRIKQDVLDGFSK